MKQRFLTEFEITLLAEEALNNFEWTCEWRKAREAASEFAADEWGVRATNAQLNTAVRRAQVGWEGVKMSVKSAIAAEAR